MKFKDCDIVEVISTKKLKGDSSNFMKEDELKKGDIVMIDTAMLCSDYNGEVVTIVKAPYNYLHDPSNFKLLKRLF